MSPDEDAARRLLLELLTKSPEWRRKDGHWMRRPIVIPPPAGARKVFRPSFPDPPWRRIAGSAEGIEATFTEKKEA